MAEQWLWIAVTAVEVLAVLVLLLLVSWIRQQAIRRRDRLAIRALVADTRKRKEERIAEITAFLSGRFGMSGDTLKRTVRAIYKGEMKLLQTFAATYLERDAATATHFGRPIQEGLAPYWELSGEAAADAGADAEEAAAEDGGGEADADVSDDGEVARLQGENERLSEELKVTMDTMSRMLNEYSTVFAKDGDIGDIKVVDEEVAPAAAPAAAAAAGAAGEAGDEAGDTAAPAIDDDPDAILAALADDEPAATEPDPAATLDPDAVLAEIGAPAEQAEPPPEAVAAPAPAAAAPDTQADPEADAMLDPDAILAATSAADAHSAAEPAAESVDAARVQPAPETPDQPEPAPDPDPDPDPDAVLAENAPADLDPDAILAAAAGEPGPAADGTVEPVVASVGEGTAESVPETADQPESSPDPHAVLAENAPADLDPDAILAAADEAVVAGSAGAQVAEEAATTDPDAILAATATPAALDAADVDPAEEDDRFAADLDPAMRDLSADDEPAESALPAASEQAEPQSEQDKAAAKRKRVIDADS